jgi:YbgC/YbaW family acyl-CoA thioester hydrolase
LPSEYRHRRRVQFYETDAAGIVHFSWFFRYMEEAEHAMWRSAGISIAPPNSEIGWPRVAVSFNYFRPLRFEDEFEVVLRVAEIAEKRIYYVCDLISNGVTLASGTMTTACVSKRPNEPMRSVPIPPEISALFQVSKDLPAGA